MTTQLPLVDNALFIDGTAFERYTTCRRSFEYYFVRKRESTGKRSPLEAGAIFHSVIELRRRLEHTMPLDKVEALQEELIHLCYAGWANRGLLSAGLLTYVMSQHPTEAEVAEHYKGFTPTLDDFRTESHMIDVTRKYNRQYAVEPFDLIFDASGVPIVEASFAYPLVSLHVPALQAHPITIYWTGRIDLPTKWPDGEVWNSDIKTSTMDKGFDEYANNQSQIGYLWALRRTLGVCPAGFMIDKVLWRPTTKSGKGIEFKRHKERIAPERIDEWERNTIAIMEDILADAARNYWPMQSAWCDGKYSTCPYLDACKMPPQGRDLILNSGFYQDVTWSPLRGTTQQPK